MACSCLLFYLGPDKGCFLCDGRVGAVADCSLELLFWNAPFPYDRSTTSPDSGYPPSQTSHNEVENPASFMIYPGVASMKQSPR